ncbi:hypothetical protein HID58_075669 [Brassica napus]|uniref:Uncharacterized protein n=1 Tax=Brassica napus TaxID=3708 RepID=A0ABQ7YLZ7_BRANA|nr:uncharacterized protein LOC125589977 [Brassica napus]XP_048618691.1 uncharacterized protein LOC125589977 [Brassica napus]XP_048618692.1 uncharacterized protein LOC125589977 [Brassica napus]KAH0868647.1 hypothetical protein HID58_075669 [Brassica napus]
MSHLPPSVMLFAFVLLLLELQLEPWKRPPASGDTASGRVLSTSDFGLSPADPDLLTETRSGAQPLHSSKSLRLRCSPTRPSFRHRRAALSCPLVASASLRSIYCSDYHRELRPLASVGYYFPPTSQATSIFPITVVKYFTLRSEVVSTISGDSFASGLRLFSNPVQSLVPLQPHCHRISFNATAIVTSRFYGAKLYHLNLHLLVTAGSIVQECGFARFARYILTVASPSHYVVSSIDGSSHCRICGPPNLLVAGTIIVQECGFARFTNFITAALPSHYAVSNIDGSSQSQLCDLQTGAVIIFNGCSQISCSCRTSTHRVFTCVLGPLLVRTRISSSEEALATSCRLVPRMNSVSSLSRVRLLSPSPPLHIPLQRDLNSAYPDSVNCYLLEAVPSTTLCVVLFRQHLHTSLQRREIQSSPEIVFSCSQFNVEFEFIAFLRMQARVLQVKASPWVSSLLSHLYHLSCFAYSRISAYRRVM